MNWISILRCPVSGSDLKMLDREELQKLQQKQADKRLWHSDGSAVNGFISQAMIAEDGGYIYAVVKDIVLLLKDLAIVDSPDRLLQVSLSEEKQQVKSFYDEKGWHENESGDYADAVIYEDLREISSDYIRKCHHRVKHYLNPEGMYMLDAASGALQYDDYLQYSEGYAYRVCLDFSFKALLEAKKKLGAKALCILGDMTNMPFKDGVMDGFVSLNTVYHIPKEEQVTAINELYRVLAVKGKGVVVYDWYKHSAWMNLWMLPFRGFVFIKNRLLDAAGKLFKTKGAPRRLYFYAHKPSYFLEQLPPYQLKVWRSLSVPFMRYYIHPWLFGRQLLNWIYKKEEENPERFGLKGEYPMLVFEK